MRSFEDSFGAKALNWMVIAGAAILLFVATLGPVPKPSAQQASAPAETVVVTAPRPTHA